MDCVSPIKNNESEFPQSKSAHTNHKSTRPQIRIIFEFTLLRPKLTYYRGVQGADGGYRMEKRGVDAKKFKTCMWTGSEDRVCDYVKTLEWAHGKQNLSAITYPATI
jgi:hypothetical protein